MIQAKPDSICFNLLSPNVAQWGKDFFPLCIFFSVYTFGQKAGKTRTRAGCLEILRKDGEKRLPEEEGV